MRKSQAEYLQPLLAMHEQASHLGRLRRLRIAASISRPSFHAISAQDNGTGMPHKDIPQLLGRVLSGTKYGVQQTRGKFGLGAKMALIWSKMSTGLPIDVRSAQKGQGFISHYNLDIDIHKCACASGEHVQPSAAGQPGLEPVCEAGFG